MSGLSTAERIRKIIGEHLDTDPTAITDKTTFIDDLGCDSLDTIEIMMAFEEEFDVEIRDDEAENVTEVGHAVALVDRLVAAKAVAA